MRTLLAAGALALAAMLAASPSQAQDGPTMWCKATADNGADATNYYSAFFAGAAYQADAKAKAFKSEVEDAEVSAATITAKCTASPDYETAVAQRNAAMKAAPGQVLDWEG